MSREFIIAEMIQKYQAIVSDEKGDIYLLDNIKFKHGRSPFVGPRKVGALMGDTITRRTEK